VRSRPSFASALWRLQSALASDLVAAPATMFVSDHRMPPMMRKFEVSVPGVTANAGCSM
jgi:hypothetical protein